MKESRLKKLKEIQKKRANYYCSLTADQSIKVGDTLFLTSLRDVIPREVTYRKVDEQNEYQLFGTSIIYHSAEKPVASTHAMIKQIAKETFTSVDVVCKSFNEASRVRQQLVKNEVLYVSQLPSVKKVIQYMNINSDVDPRVKKTIHHRLDELHGSADKAMRAYNNLFNGK